MKKNNEVYFATLRKYWLELHHKAGVTACVSYTIFFIELTFIKKNA